MSNVDATIEEKYQLVAQTIRSYPLQLESSWQSVIEMDFSKEYLEVDNVVLCGMGGSALGGRIVKSACFSKCRVPFEIVNDYELPNYAGPKTLAIISSYSGTTEEALSCLYKAIDKGCKIFGITAGGKLAEVLKENQFPSYIIDEKYNPSRQPRMSIGYASGSILALLTKLGIIHILTEDIDDLVSAMHKMATEFHEHSPETTNVAKRLSATMRNRSISFVASEHLVGSAHTVKNQLNESAKTFAAIFELPELNHHLLEGLARPIKQKDSMTFFFFESDLYGERTQKRYKVSEEIVKKCGIETLVYRPKSEKRLTQAFEVVMLGSYLTYFLSSFYKIDPLIIPWVDYFKEQMGKSK